MNEPIVRLHLVESTAMRVERCLRALTDCIGDTSIDAEVRRKLTEAHAELHACRSAETVARMERKMDLQK